MTLEEFTQKHNFLLVYEDHVGAEEELWLTNTRGHLVNRVLDLLRAVAHQYMEFQLPGFEWSFEGDFLDEKAMSSLAKIKEALSFQPELSTSQIEIQTSLPSMLIDVVEGYLIKRRKILLAAAKKLKMKILPVGTPMFPYEAELFPLRYYQRIKGAFQGPLQNAFISGLHIHYGVKTPEEAVKVYNAFREYLPVFLALSANSPFLEGVQTFAFSNRYLRYSSIGSDIIPPHLNEWRDYYHMSLERRYVDGTKQNWQLIRIHPKYGTVELRVCDVQPTVRDTILLVGLAKLVAYKALREKISKERFSHQNLVARLSLAAQYGCSDHEMNGEFRASVIERIKSLAEVAKRTPQWNAKGAPEIHVGRLLKQVDNTPAQRQLKVFQETGSLEQVVRSLQREIEEEIKHY